MDSQQNERLVLAGQSLGEAQRAIELTVDYLQQRPAFGARLIDNQYLQYTLAELACEDIPGFEVSDMELKRPGTTYTVDTLRAIKAQLAGLPHPDAARRCLSEYGAVIVCRSIDECAEVADRLAPEHLQIMTGDPEAVAEKVCNAAAVFVGLYTPVAVGDYVAGPSHTLPTSRTARFASGLSANDFLRRVAVIRYDRTALEDDAQTIARLARTEGLEGHARSVEVRMLPGREAPPAR